MDSLFSIEEKNLNTGLRGFPVGTCYTSQVRPDEGLFYRGIPVCSLAKQPPEAVIFLLLYNHLPSSEELSKFQQTLEDRSTIPSSLLQALAALPPHLSPMTLYSIVLNMLGDLEASQGYAEDALSLIAKLPTLIACIINHHQKLPLTLPSSPSAQYIDRFCDTLALPMRSSDFRSTLALFFNLHLDHGGGNLSTFVGKATASGLQSLHHSLSAAMLALAGPKHGYANLDCVRFLEKVLATLGDHPSHDRVASFLHHCIDQGELIYGFGHAVLRLEDIRATVLYDHAKTLPSHPLVDLATKMREVAPDILRQRTHVSDPYPNVDGISGSVLIASGFTQSEYFPLLFGLSRSVGIAIQITLERTTMREGKGIPIYRPKYLYQDEATKEIHYGHGASV